ncbi:MAG: hypothetical protein MRECE_8c033 [Mycoplasmataceae bacterium CE_OT135]|nr:MAG: hypothetical protein MRECE_8c033 [Mycoplasmataceae bacterium CE_OT135]
MLSPSRIFSWFKYKWHISNIFNWNYGENIPIFKTFEKKQCPFLNNKIGIFHKR